MTMDERMQMLCRDKGVTLGGLEKQFGFGNGALYKWETNTPGIDRVQKIADYFGVSIDFLARGYDGPAKNNKSFNKYTILDLVRGTDLSVNQVISVLDQAKSAILDEAVVGNGGR